MSFARLTSVDVLVLMFRYRGERVAVDAYSWLHKAAYSCSYELCEGIPTDRCSYVP